MSSEFLLRPTPLKKIRSSLRSFIGQILDTERRKAAWFLYSWCRHCDQQINEATDASTASVHLESFKKELLLIYQTPQAASLPESCPSPLQALHYVIHKYEIPYQYPYDLLRGFEMDLNANKYQNWLELREYCYCVAGTIGAMMCHIMGVKNAQAIQHAIDMGSAMQITNICRDIREDYGRDRIYLPLEDLDNLGIKANQLLFKFNQDRLFRLVDQLLKRADCLYANGLAGLQYLPWRSAIVVACIQKNYYGIGESIRRKGKEALFNPHPITKKEKLIYGAQALLQLLKGWLWQYQTPASGKIL